VVAAIKWWRPLAEAAYRSLGQNSALYSDAALATGISLYRKYHGDKNRLAEMAQRFLASNQMIVLKTLDYRQTRWFVNNIMKGMNYRVIKDYAELYGETGRE
jgi:hypothetical protein